MADLPRDAALEIQLRAFADFVALLGGSAPGSRLVERGGGIRAAVVPAVPERSIANSVTYREAAALAEALEGLAAAYREAGVAAWTVWAPELDREALAALQRAGHSFDGRPLAMVLDLAGFEPPDPGELDWDVDADLPLLGELNDTSYGHRPEDGFAAAFRHRPPGLDLRLYQARVGGAPACVLATIDHAAASGAAGPDCGIYFVATPARFRGRGLATRLLGVALGEARERGCATSSLQASSLGEPVYRALGYQPCFRFHMYERRDPKGSR